MMENIWRLILILGTVGTVAVLAVVLFAYALFYIGVLAWVAVHILSCVIREDKGSKTGRKVA